MASILKTSALCLYRHPGVLFPTSSKHLLKLHTLDSYRIPPGDKPSLFPKDPVIPPREHIEYEVSNSPEEWKFVERLLPAAVVPEPIKKDEYPSGWKPPSASVGHLPYFIRRNKNHMPNVYLNKALRGQRIRTNIRKITGDIWALNNDLLLHLKEKHNKDIVSQVNEVTCCIWLKGDYVRDVEEWMLNKGF